MGDRVNICMRDEGKNVYFYGHWSGYDAPEIVRKALARKQRWDDPSYLARIVFCHLLGGDRPEDGIVLYNVKAETGFGISTEPQDNSYPIIVVSTPDNRVTIEADDRPGFNIKPSGEVKSYSFDEYVALPRATWAALDTGLSDDDE